VSNPSTLKSHSVVQVTTSVKILLRSALSVFVGLFVGILFSYLVYRLSLPVEPFVYVAF
jgi:hypothetical protein